MRYPAKMLNNVVYGHIIMFAIIRLQYNSTGVKDFVTFFR